MNPELLKKILAVIASGDEAAALALLPELVAAEAAEEGGEMPPADPTAAAAEPPQPNPDQPPAKNSKDLDVEALRARVEAFELKERRDLIATLVKCGAETPATAWKKDAKGNVTHTPCARLMSEPLDDMRERVAVLAKAAPKRAEHPEETESSEAPKVEYSPAVQAQLAKMNPAQRAKFEQMQANSFATRKGLRK
jgi:hypothetical protein